MVQLDDYLIKLAADLPRRFEYARGLRRRFIFEELQGKVNSFMGDGKSATVLLPGKGGADFVLTVDGRKYVVEVGLGKDRAAQVRRSMERVSADRGIVIGEKFYANDDILSIPWRTFLGMI